MSEYDGKQRVAGRPLRIRELTGARTSTSSSIGRSNGAADRERRRTAYCVLMSACGGRSLVVGATGHPAALRGFPAQLHT